MQTPLLRPLVSRCWYSSILVVVPSTVMGRPLQSEPGLVGTSSTLFWLRGDNWVAFPQESLVGGERTTAVGQPSLSLPVSGRQITDGVPDRDLPVRSWDSTRLSPGTAARMNSLFLDWGTLYCQVSSLQDREGTWYPILVRALTHSLSTSPPLYFIRSSMFSRRKKRGR